MVTSYEDAMRSILGRLRYRLSKGIGDREVQEDMVARILARLESDA